MMTMVSETELRKGYQLAVVLGVMMLSSIVILLVVLNVLLTKGSLRTVPDSAISVYGQYIVIGIAVLTYLILKPVRNYLLSTKSLPASQENALNLPVPVAKLLNLSIVIYGICDFAAITGTIFSFITADLFYAYLGVGLSAIIYWPYFPRYQQWQEWVAEYERREELGL